MALDTLIAKANTGEGTDGLAGGAANSAGGGAITGGISRGIVRRYTLVDLEDDLEEVARTIRRPKARRERKQSLQRISPALDKLITQSAGLNDTAPLALSDLSALLAQTEAVAARQIAFAEWRDLVLRATMQALAEIEARRMMEDEEEAAILLMMQ